MEKTIAKLTVFFEEPFWVGLYERECDEQYEVCKITFGAEPKDYDVFEFMLRNWSRLTFSPAFESKTAGEKQINPKRMQRVIRKQLQNVGIGTKAQQALKLQHEQGKTASKTRTREQKEAEKERQFQIKQDKRKEKHRGH